MTDLLLLSALAVLAMLGSAIGVTRLFDYILTARLAEDIAEDVAADIDLVRAIPATRPLRALVA